MRPVLPLSLIAASLLACTSASTPPEPEKQAPLAPAKSTPPAPQPQAPLAPAPAAPRAPSPPAAATTPAGEVKALITRHGQLNDTCRGGSGDNPATMKACDERDALYKQIEARGWCWGPDDRIEAEKTWVRCVPKAK